MLPADGIQSYAFGAKNHWRRTAWNSIRRRLKRAGANLSTCRVGYLAGIEDIDRAVAMEKGFRPNNLLAISRDDHVVRSIKGNGGLAIAADAQALLWAMPKCLNLSAIVLDFCCGYTGDVIGCQFAIAMTEMPKDAVILINLMRGRDAFSNEARAAHDELWTRLSGERVQEKHRGIHFWSSYAMFVAMAMTLNDVHEAFRRQHLRIPTEIDPMALIAVMKNTRPEFLSYRSMTGQIFDTVIFNKGGGISEQAVPTRTMPDEIRKVRKSLTAIAATITRRCT